MAIAAIHPRRTPSILPRTRPRCESSSMTVIDLDKVPIKSGSSYPKQFHQVRGNIAAKKWQPVGDAAGLTMFGVNRMMMEPGAASSLRHWHTHEDELVVILEGELVLITNEG